MIYKDYALFKQVKQAYKCSLKTFINTPEWHTSSELNNETKTKYISGSGLYQPILSLRLKLTNKIPSCYLMHCASATWEFQERTVDQYEKEWFRGKGVCQMLRYSETITKKVKKVCKIFLSAICAMDIEEYKKVITFFLLASLIPFALVVHQKSPAAKAIKAQVCLAINQTTLL